MRWCLTAGLVAALLGSGCSGGAAGLSTTTLESSAATTTSGVTTTSVTTTSTTKPVVTTTTERNAGVDLDEALAAIGPSECVTANTTLELLAATPGDPMFDDMGLAGSIPGGGSVTLTGVPLFRGSLQYQMFTSASDEAIARLHASLFLNQLRNLASYFDYFDPGGTFIVYGSSEGARQQDPDAVFASWDFSTVDYGGGVETSSRYEDTLRSDSTTVADLGDEALEEAWRMADVWLEEIGPIIDIDTAYDLEALAAALEPLAAGIDDAIRLFCVIAVGESQGEPSDGQVLRSIAAEELLLATEYLAVIADRMSVDGIDWMRGPDVDLALSPDGHTSTGEDLVVWQYALDLSLYLQVFFRGEPGTGLPLIDIPQASG
jgi:hypothetical protein